MDKLKILSNKIYENKKYFEEITILLNNIKKDKKFLNNFKSIINKYNMINMIIENKNNISKLEIKLIELKNEKSKILTKMRFFEEKIIDKNDVNNKLESYFIFFNSITGYGYLYFKQNLNWELIKITFNEYKNEYINKIININNKVIDTRLIKNLDEDIRMKFGNSYEYEEDILYDIIYLLENINTFKFFNKIFVMKKELVLKDKYYNPYIKFIPEYFYKNSIYNGHISLKIGEKVFKFKNPSLDNIKSILPHGNFFNINII